MVATELARAMNGVVLERTAGKISMKLVSFNKEDVTPLLERRFEIQAEIKGSFYPIYSVYCAEVRGRCKVSKAQSIAEKEYRQFAKNFN